MDRRTAPRCGAQRWRPLFEPVLLLNASFEPLNVIDWRRAIKLVFTDKVEVVAHSGRWVHGVSTAMRVPSVVRLVHYVRYHRRTARFSRRNIYARDAHTCQYCGRRFPASELTCDHVVPRSRGGRTNWRNIVTCCVTCNRRKGGRTPREAGMRLLRPPREPTWLWSFGVRLGGRRPPAAWRDWVRVESEGPRRAPRGVGVVPEVGLEPTRG